MTEPFLQKLADDFAWGMQRADARGPIATNARSGAAFRPGLGPHSESKTLALVLAELIHRDPTTYGSVRRDVCYPKSPRQRCDLVISSDGNTWHVEAKMMRLMGDNAKTNDNILTHILSPYAQHRSALTDCEKLVASGFPGHSCILIYGYSYKGWPLEPVISAFETLAAQNVSLSPRATSTFSGLMHPVHREGAVFAWEVSSRD